MSFFAVGSIIAFSGWQDNYGFFKLLLVFRSKGEYEVPWHKNGRILITLGAFVIGFLFVVLLEAQGAAKNEAPRQEAAVAGLIQTEQENQQLANDNAKLRQELAKYAEGQNTEILAARQLQEAKMNAGLVEVSGPGVRIILDDATERGQGADAENYVIHEGYIREIVNALWNGGAEAIAVNGQRVTSYTEVFCMGSYIQINGTRQMPPYIIEAVGDSYNLQSALNFYVWDKLGDFQQQYGITRDLDAVEELVIPGGKIKNFRYAEPVKEGM